MKNIVSYLRFVVVILMIILVDSCSEAPQDDVYKQLEEKGKISTFPLNIVLTSNLYGDNFPDDLKRLVALSPGPCKTLPVAGILRLGPDQYYTYNGVSSLKLDPDDADEKSITSSVSTQTNEYLAKTTLKDFDSLKVPISSEYSSQILATDYIKGTVDSVFFYSAVAGSPELTVMGGRSFTIYKDMDQLRKKIDEIICTKQVTISVIYTPSPTSASTVAPPSKGIYAGDTCVGTSKYEKLNDGKGNLFIGKLLEQNSKSCGFAFPTGIAGDTCVGKSRYQRLHNGRGGFVLGQLIEKNSTTCGFTFPTGIAGDSCSNGSRYQKMHDGKGGFMLGNIIEKNSRACGFKPLAVETPAPIKTPVKAPTTPPVTASRPAQNQASQPATNQPAVSARQIVRPGVDNAKTVTPPPVNTTTSRPGTTTPVQTPKTTVQTSELPDAGTPPGAAVADKRCASTSEALCEQDSNGGYTGRRVQYCYNSAGKIIRTIVLAKCDRDCRCF